jgi:spore germination cell wall hydrolase CwlJ-like protein
MKHARKRNRFFSKMKRDVFSYRYLKRNVAAVATVVGAVALITTVVKLGEMADYTQNYQYSVSSEASYGEAVMAEASITDTVQEEAAGSTVTKQAKTNNMYKKAETTEAEVEEESEFDGKFIAQIDDTLNVRAEATTDSDIVGKMFDGNVGDILGTDGDWVNISSGDVTGYVNSAYILTGKDAEEYALNYKKMLGTITDETVRIRSGNSTESDVLGLASQGSIYNVVSQDEDWVKIITESGEEGYVSADYISVEETYEYAMTIDDYTYMCEKETETDVTEYASNDSYSDSAELMSVADQETATETAYDTVQEEPVYEEPASETVTEEPATEQPTEAATEEPATETQDTSTASGEYSDSYLLACLVSMEAGYEPYEGQLAVANVVLNRVKSGYWGSSISSVIYAPNQFPCATGSVMQGYLENGPLSTAQQAANDALAGNNNIGSFMSFLNVNYIDTDSLSDYEIIGNHCFY